MKINSEIQTQKRLKNSEFSFFNLKLNIEKGRK